MDGMQLLRAHPRARTIATAVIVLTGYGTIESAVEAMKLGAADYLIKDARPQEVLLTIERTLKLAGARARERAPAQRDRPLRRASASSSARATPMQAIYRAHRRGQPEQEHRADHRARAAPARSSSRAPSTGAARVADGPVRRDQLRGPLRDAARQPALRPPARRVHRRRRRPRRRLPGRGRRHALPRRGRRDPAVAAGEVPARRPGARGDAARLDAGPIPVDVRLIAATNRDLDAEVPRRPLPRRPLLPPERRAHRGAAAARAAATTSRSWSTHFLARFSRALSRRAEADRARGARAHHAPTTGRATSASCRTSSSGRSRSRRRRRSPIAELPPAVAGRANRFHARASPTARCRRSPRPSARLVAAALRRERRQQERGGAPARHRPPAALPEDREVRALEADPRLRLGSGSGRENAAHGGSRDRGAAAGKAGCARTSTRTSSDARGPSEPRKHSQRGENRTSEPLSRRDARVLALPRRLCRPRHPGRAAHHRHMLALRPRPKT